MKCHKCSYEWNYTGKSKFYITCPQCYSKTFANSAKAVKIADMQKRIKELK